MIYVRRLKAKFYPNPKRVITRFFMPGSERAKHLIEKLIKFPEKDVALRLNYLLEDFSGRHRKITSIFKDHFIRVKEILKAEHDYTIEKISFERLLLIGSYFTMEYSIESAAFFNPSIVNDPDQSSLEEGQKRVIVSFRATGEGHISSLVFRSGILTKDNELIFKAFTRLVEIPETIKRHVYNKGHFFNRVQTLLAERRTGKRANASAYKNMIDDIMSGLKDRFIYGELLASIEKYTEDKQLPYQQRRALNAIETSANSHYEMKFSYDTVLSERVIFPFSFTESKGIEDMRFVEFIDDDGSIIYYSTYTGYSEGGILPKFISTKDFRKFKVLPMNGEYAKDKGMALFPRKIKGKYVMLSRLDGASNYIMNSDKINIWNNRPQKIHEPTYPWELIQVGNCGSPLETKQGWLVITHGVGPVRQYSLGAILLDLDNPTKVIARMKTPLMVPNEDEREGYVPNVVYSCGSILHNGELIIPYSMSDYASGFAAVNLETLLDKKSFKRQ
ncbi:MAG: glycosidase [Deltaproteobacteria bacterium]|nr:MAG: glycosidase [Deltaproteobacteria bacterium]